MSDSAFGYRLTFHRDLIYKFLSPQSRKSISQSPWSQSPWRVAGKFDSLQITPIERFDTLEIEASGKLAPHASYGDLVLFPLDPSDAERLEQVSLSQPGNQHPLLVCTTVTLSPGVYEFGSHYGVILETIRRTAQQVRAHVAAEGFPWTVVLGSLGGPDLAIISLPDDAHQLRAVHGLVHWMRVKSLQSIAPPGESKWPGHACSLVEPVVAFSRQARDVFNQKSFKKSETDNQLRLRFALRLDCGHEGLVAADLAQNFPEVQLARTADNGSTYVPLAPHTIHGAVSHFADLTRLLDERWYQLAWRETNLVDTLTYVAFPASDAELQVEDTLAVKAWQTNDGRDGENIEDELARIHTSLTEFGNAFLGRAQKAELDAIFASFESCFYRHEYLSASRDLFPFFRQLARMLGNKEYWQKYLDTSVPLGEARNRRRDKFDHQVQAMLSHLSRALRNRIEHRSVDTNPFLPTALEHGACKLVSAYTVVIWLCCELFRLDGDDPPGELCDTEHFAACLCAGSEGRVLCQELFREFRLFVERENGQRLSKLAPNGWTARPWLLEISGRSLVRPELCVVHCMHEVAELSEWIRFERCAPFRFSINRWLLKEVVANAVQISCQDAEQAGMTFSDADRQAELDYAEAVLLWCIAAVTRPGGASDPAHVEEAIAKLCSETDPEHTIGIVRRAVFEQGVREVTGGELGAANLPDSPVPRQGRVAHLNDRRFMRALDVLENLVPELIGDVGMFSALDHILQAMGMDRSTAQRFDDLCRVFESLLTAAMESRGPLRSRARVERLIVHRWAVQAAAVTGGVDFIDDILDRLDALRERMQNAARQNADSSGRQQPVVTSRDEFKQMLQWSVGFDIQFKMPSGLVSELRKLKAYGGEQSLHFAELSCFPAAVKDILRTFIKVWESHDDQDRLQLAMELWAKSERLTFKHVLMRAT